MFQSRSHSCSVTSTFDLWANVTPSLQTSQIGNRWRNTHLMCDHMAKCNWSTNVLLPVILFQELCLALDHSSPAAPYCTMNVHHLPQIYPRCHSDGQHKPTIARLGMTPSLLRPYAVLHSRFRSLVCQFSLTKHDFHMLINNRFSSSVRTHSQNSHQAQPPSWFQWKCPICELFSSFVLFWLKYEFIPRPAHVVLKVLTTCHMLSRFPRPFSALISTNLPHYSIRIVIPLIGTST